MLFGQVRVSMRELFLQPGIGCGPLGGELGIAVCELVGQPLISKRPLFRQLAVRPGVLSGDQLVAVLPLIPDPPVCPPLAPDRYTHGGDRNGDSADCCKGIPDHARSLGSGEGRRDRGRGHRGRRAVGDGDVKVLMRPATVVPAGTPVSVISALLGHSSIAVTARYRVHLSNHQAITALEAAELPDLGA
jgi:integrase